MNVERLQVLLDAYGAEPARWPDDERAAALALLTESAAARAAHADARQLDDWLDVAPPGDPGDVLRARILSSVPPPVSSWRDFSRELWDALGGWRLALPAFALSLSLGVLLPLLWDESATDLPAEDLLAAVQWVDDLPESFP